MDRYLTLLTPLHLLICSLYLLIRSSDVINPPLRPTTLDTSHNTLAHKINRPIFYANPHRPVYQSIHLSVCLIQNSIGTGI